MKRCSTIEVANEVHREFRDIADNTGLKMKNVASAMVRLWKLSPKETRDQAILTAMRVGSKVNKAEAVA